MDRHCHVPEVLANLAAVRRGPILWRPTDDAQFGVGIPLYKDQHSKTASTAKAEYIWSMGGGSLLSSSIHNRITRDG